MIVPIGFPPGAGEYTVRVAIRHGLDSGAGSGAGAYMQLSGTSMAAGVVSGAVAVLLEERPALAPRDTKVALQVTSSFMPSFGLIGAGAGSLNVVAAVQSA